MQAIINDQIITVENEISHENNPGLARYDLSDFRGTKGINFFTDDSVHVRLMTRELPGDLRQDALKHLTEFGRLCSEELDSLVFAAHKEGKYGYLEKFDRSGNRIDEIIYCEEQKKARKLAYDAGIVNLDYHKDWKHPFHFLHRMGLAYLLNQDGEAGICCPLAMTDGLIEILRQVGTKEQQQRYLPILTDPELGSHFMAGQYVTERVGGSNVSANRTVARKMDNGRYLLYGEKWFCSNPGDLWVTTARLEGSSIIGLFLVSRYKENGDLNDHHILRTKDIIGSRGKVTAEIEYRGVEAEALGRPSRGLSYLLQFVLKASRVHVAVGGLGMGRRAYLEAYTYAKSREAYGKKLNAYPLVVKNLLTMKTLQTASQLAVFRSWQLMIDQDPLEQLLVPLLKYKVSSQGSFLAREAILVLGGNGIIGDFSILPRLLLDNIINETWEGTHNILGEHTIKAFRRPKIQRRFFDQLQTLTDNVYDYPQLEKIFLYFNALKSNLDIQGKELASWDAIVYQINVLPLCDLLYKTYALALLIYEAMLDLQQGQDTFTLFAQSFCELDERNTIGLVAKDSLFSDMSKMMRLLEY